MKKTTDTSAISLKEMHDKGLISRQHTIILNAMRGVHGWRTDRELAALTPNVDLIAFRARRNELWNKGLIARSEKRICTISGKLAYTWSLAQNMRK